MTSAEIIQQWIGDGIAIILGTLLVFLIGFSMVVTVAYFLPTIPIMIEDGDAYWRDESYEWLELVMVLGGICWVVIGILTVSAAVGFLADVFGVAV